jgi:hypothetical protein
VYCELDIVDDNDTDSFPDIILLSLRSLMLTDGLTPGYLNTFIVPALHSLRILEPFLAPSCIDTLSSFVAKSDCKLQELCVTGRRSESKGSYRHAFLLATISFDR